MKRNCLVLIFLFMLLLTASALALTADVTMKIDGRLPSAPAPQIYTGADNRVEMWITNSAKLKGMSLGLRFAGECPFSLVTPYGNVPEGSEMLQEQGVNNNFLNSFGAGNLSVTWNQISPTLAEFTMGGADASPGQTKNLFFTQCQPLATASRSILLQVRAAAISPLPRSVFHRQATGSWMLVLTSMT